MLLYIFLTTAWLAALAAAGPYAARVRHPELRPTEAYLIFALAFSVGSLAGFGVSVFALEFSGAAAASDMASHLIAGSVALWSGWRLARWIVRKPPLTAPTIE